MDEISLALWGRQFAELSDLSELEDVVHLHTHRRHGRDLFVSTDRRMLNRADTLKQLGIRVRSPAEAMNEARVACDSG